MSVEVSVRVTGGEQRVSLTTLPALVYTSDNSTFTCFCNVIFMTKMLCDAASFNYTVLHL